jgi:hypothetical protein
MRGSDIVDLFHGEPVEADDLCCGAKRRRKDAPSFLLGVRLGDDPGAVHSVLATPVGVREKVGPGGQENLDNAGTRLYFFRMRDFNQKPRH